MADQNGSGTVVDLTTTKRRKASARKPSTGAARRPRKAAARRKTATRRPAAGASISFESVIRSITGGVAVARAAIAEASENGASAVMRAADTASRASRRTVTRLAGEWRSMEPRKKARLLAALLGAAAAASVPLVRKSLKK
jgi:septum formation inhibitor-activating ATPase MinD